MAVELIRKSRGDRSEEVVFAKICRLAASKRRQLLERFELLLPERPQYRSPCTRVATWRWHIKTDRLELAAFDLFGYPHSEVVNAHWWIERIHPAERDSVLTGLRAVVAGSDRHWSDKYRFRRYDGSYAHTLDEASIIRDATGTPVRMIGYMSELVAWLTMVRPCSL